MKLKKKATRRQWLSEKCSDPLTLRGRTSTLHSRYQLLEGTQALKVQITTKFSLCIEAVSILADSRFIINTDTDRAASQVMISRCYVACDLRVMYCFS